MINNDNRFVVAEKIKCKSLQGNFLGWWNLLGYCMYVCVYVYIERIFNMWIFNWIFITLFIYAVEL